MFLPASLKRTLHDTSGSVLVEATIMLTIIFVLVLGGIDFLFAFYQWNAAAKAVQVGARLAAVSDPLVSGLMAPPPNNVSAQAVDPTSPSPGGPMPNFTVTCDGSTGACTCSGFCTGIGTTINQSALDTIVYGRGYDPTSPGPCHNSTNGIYFAGMCSMFPRITPAKVKITYTQTGLGYAGRPCGPVPTIQVSLQGLNFQFFFLQGLMGFGKIPITPSSAAPTTITGEAMSSNSISYAESCPSYPTP